MPRKIDTAYVEYLPDFTKFERIVDQELSTSFRAVERSADTATATMEREFSRLGQDIEDVFREIALTGEVDMERLVSVADRTANSISRDFQREGEVSENSFRELRRTADLELDRIDRSASQTASATAGKFNLAGLAASGAFLGIGAALVAGGTALTTFGLKSAASIEQTKISFTALTGSAENGLKTFNDLQKFAAVTPFEFPEVAAAAKRFLAFHDSVGLSVDSLQDYLNTIGNVVSVTGGGGDAMSRISLAIGQIGSTSKVTLDNLNQIADAIPGFSPISAIAKSMGITTAEAMERVSAGTISAKDGIAALLDGMSKFPGAAGAMEMQSQTLLGVFSTFKDTVSLALSNAFSPVIPQIKQTLTDLTPILGDALKAIAPALGEVLATVLPLVGNLVKGLAPILTPLIHAINDVLSPLGPQLQPLGEAIGKIVVAFAPLAPILGTVISQLVQALIPAIEQWAADPNLPLLVESFGELAVALLPLIPPLSDLLVLFAKISGPQMSAIVTVKIFTEWVQKLIALDWGGLASGMVHKLGDAIGAVGTFFQNLPGQIMSFLSNLPSMLANLAVQAFDALTTAVGFGIAKVILFFVNLPATVASLVASLWDTVKNLFASGADNAKNNAIGGLQAFLDWVSGLPDKVIGFVSSLPSKLLDWSVNLAITAFNIGKSLIEGIGHGVEAAISGLGNLIKRGLDNVMSGVKKGLGIASPSQVWADEIGAQIPAGIQEGIQTAIPSVTGVLNTLMPLSLQPPAGATGGAAAASAVNPNFTVIVQIDGQQLEGRIIGIVNERDRALKQSVLANRGR